MRRILFLLFIFCIVSGCNSTSDDCVMAVEAVDGDTIVISTGETVRLIGIDAPEKGRPYSKIAKNELEMLVNGTCLRLEKDISDKDQYGRLLRYVYAGDDFVNELIVRKGLATSFEYGPDVKYANVFKDAEKKARNDKIGMWK